MDNLDIKRISDAVDRHQQRILDAERYIWANPETGYREVKTSAFMEKTFEELGYEITRADGITGFYTVIDTGREGPCLLILGELDSIICPSHPESDPVTGAVHSCGHNAQCAALVGIAAALKESGMLDGLSGKIMLCAVPAEELLEIEFRKGLRAEGKIRYFGGKSEFLSRGYFDGVDLAFMVHTSRSFAITRGSVGCIAKSIIYKGVAAHAGGSPQSGKNALYAATCGINAINAIRETFTEADTIRVHPIITHGGDMVNAIPERVCIESYVRGKTFKAIEKANRRVNQALCGAALSIGTNIEIIDIPGYSPHVNSTEMMDVCAEAAELVLSGIEVHRTEGYSSGSTDMGDLSQIMPVIHPYCGGSVGTSHGNDYGIANPGAACVNSAKWQLGMLTLLLEDGAQRAKQVIDAYKPPFESAKALLEYMDSLNDSGDRIVYGEDGVATVRIDK